MGKREYDLVIWGATGFTGKLVAEYLARQYGTGQSLQWAIAGRNRDKLEQVRRRLPLERTADLPILLADSDDQASLDALVTSTRVVCTTVGPYALYGTPLVAACAREGTHYCDLTGEVQWMARVIPEYQDTARDSGARIVHCCGFDSIPSDLGTWFLQQAMLEQHGVPAAQVKGRVGKVRGGASGGTIASMVNLMEEAQRDPSVRRVTSDPYCLYPPGVPAGSDGLDQRDARFDPDFNQWTSPFVMAVINNRVVRRTNALLDFPWGADFRYEEAVLETSRWRATRNALAAGVGMAALALGPTRRVATRLLPSPGEGPSQRQREAGHYELFFHGIHPDDRSLDLRARVTGDMDPGYGSTSKMLAEAAVCLAHDELAVDGGFWTPASALGGALLQRLVEHAGLTFDIIPID